MPSNFNDMDEVPEDPYDPRATRYNISVPIEPTGRKKFWHKIGIATEQRDGKIACHIESIPLNWDGVFYLFMDER